jgi:hypothetical protein
MPKSKHRRKGKNRARPASQSAPTFDDPELAALLAAAESDGAFDDPDDDPEMAEALAQAEAELADELAAAGEDGDLGPYLGDPPDDEEFGEESGEEMNAAMASLIEVVENQLRANDPPAVAVTLARLVAAGHARDEAVALIGAVLMFELNEMLRSERTYDAASYARKLANLPALPDLG